MLYLAVNYRSKCNLCKMWLGYQQHFDLIFSQNLTAVSHISFYRSFVQNWLTFESYRRVYPDLFLITVIQLDILFLHSVTLTIHWCICYDFGIMFTYHFMMLDIDVQMANEFVETRKRMATEILKWIHC